MQGIIIADTSCLILLQNINQLEILNNLYGTIKVTIEVFHEYGNALPNWIIIENPKDENCVLIIEQELDKGEASSIALALELDDCLLILDDLKARKFATQLGLNIIGTLGVIVDAKLKGIIPSIKPLLREISKTNFRISAQVEKILLDKAGE